MKEITSGWASLPGFSAPTHELERLATAYQFEVVRDRAALLALAPEWRKLHREATPAAPFLSFEWMLACWEQVEGHAGLFVVVARRHGQLVGIAPLRRERRWGFRLLSFLGKGVTPYVGFLCAPRHPGVETALLEHLASLGSEWDLLRLMQLASPFTELHRLPPGGSCLQRAEPCPWSGASYMALDGDWEALRRSLRWIKEGHRRVARFERDGGSVERYTGREAAARVEEILSVERRSWQGLYGQTHSEHERTRLGTLLRSAFASLTDGESLELWLGRITGEPVAYQINFLSPERIWLYRGAYDQQFAGLSPGVVLDYLSIRAAWAEGRREFDYLSGGEAYKAHRARSIRPLMQFGAAPRTLRGHLAFAALVRLPSCLRRMRTADELLQFLSRVRKSPRSLLPGSGAVASRVHH